MNKLIQKQTEDTMAQGIVIHNTITAPSYYFKEVLSLEEASDYMSITSGTLYQFVHRRQIPFYKPTGKKTYFKRADLDVFMLRNRVSANYELADKADALLNHSQDVAQ
jgi:excisionase family DNA binding protein